ncbi:hypothetical protein ABIB06_000885 [Bradyrhizobium sp. LB8.2]
MGHEQKCDKRGRQLKPLYHGILRVAGIDLILRAWKTMTPR